MERKSGITLIKTFIKNCIIEKKAFFISYLNWIQFCLGFHFASVDIWTKSTGQQICPCLLGDGCCKWSTSNALCHQTWPPIVTWNSKLTFRFQLQGDQTEVRHLEIAISIKWVKIMKSLLSWKVFYHGIIAKHPSYK